MDEANIETLASIVWGYTKIGAKLEPTDAIIAMGSMDMRVPERAADLWRQKFAPVIVVTGGLGRLTGDDVTVSEAAKFATVLHACGIPDEAVLIEDKASNGAENFTFSVAMLRKNGNPAVKVIAVTQPPTWSAGHTQQVKSFFRKWTYRWPRQKYLTKHTRQPTYQKI